MSSCVLLCAKPPERNIVQHMKPWRKTFKAVNCQNPVLGHCRERCTLQYINFYKQPQGCIGPQILQCEGNKEVRGCSQCVDVYCCSNQLESVMLWTSHFLHCSSCQAYCLSLVVMCEKHEASQVTDIYPGYVALQGAQYIYIYSV